MPDEVDAAEASKVLPEHLRNILLAAAKTSDLASVRVSNGGGLPRFIKKSHFGKLVNIGYLEGHYRDCRLTEFGTRVLAEADSAQKQVSLKIGQDLLKDPKKLDTLLSSLSEDSEPWDLQKEPC